MLMVKKIWNGVVFGLATILLASCGGGGSSSDANQGGIIEPNLVSLNGAVEKGPYIIGSSITIGKLNENGQPIDTTLVTQTINDLGDFSFSYEENTLIQIKADGYYRNEITGELSVGTLNLRSIYVVSSEIQQKAYVNILTHLISNRVLELILQGNSPSDAIIIAENEILSHLEPVVPAPSIDSFSSLSLYDAASNAEGSAYITLISSLFYQYSLSLSELNSTNPDAELSLILNELANDLSDGIIEDASVFGFLRQTIPLINPVEVQLHLNEFARLANSSSSSANINLFLDSDLDGITNEYDGDDDNDGIEDSVDDSPYRKNFSVDHQSIETDEEVDVSITLESNNPTGGEIDYVVIQQPANGVLIGDFPNIIYRPNLNYNGLDFVKLYLSQGGITSNTITITISISSENDVPVIAGMPESEVTAYNEYIFTPSTNDIEGDELDFSIINKPHWLNFSSATGTLSGTPSNDEAGTYSEIIITASDGISDASLDPFSIMVEPSPWQPLADLPLPSRGGAAAEHGGVLYYFGGTASDMKSVYAYDTLTDSWSEKASMPKGVHNLSAFTIGDKIYVISGYGEGAFVNDTMEYDPINDSWQSKTPRPTYRYVFSSAELNGLIYVIGGQGTVDDGPWRSGVAWTYKDYVEIYDPITDSWSNGAASPTLLAQNAACVLDGKIYVIGGEVGQGHTASVYLYDPELDSWSTSQSLPMERGALSCAVVNQKLYVLGGRTNVGPVATVESYNLSSAVWEEHQSLSVPKYWFPVLSYNNKIYVFGGYTAGSPLVLQKVEVYDPAIDR